MINNQSPLFMLVAGELSGDLLGAGLIKALKIKYPKAQFFGIGGPQMIEEGLESIEPIETLSIMGLVEVIKHLPSLLRLKRRLLHLARERKPIAFIGIDAPDFNLRLSKTLKKADITTTFQYVSPSIWVWRKGRAKTIRRYIDRILCLFPFEVTLYEKYSADAICVGHRLGDEIPLNPDMVNAKKRLNIDDAVDNIAILPGSRMGEIERLLSIFLDSIVAMKERHPAMKYLIPAANEKIYQLIEQEIADHYPMLMDDIIIVNGQSRVVMEASKAVLLASGTASLEAMLLKKPMVVAYRFNAFTAWLAPKIVNIRLFSLPNILAGRAIVPELFQATVTVENIVFYLEKTLDDTYRESLIPQFYQLHEKLRLNSDEMAANAIIDKLKEKECLN